MIWKMPVGSEKRKQMTDTLKDLERISIPGLSASSGRPAARAASDVYF